MKRYTKRRLVGASLIVLMIATCLVVWAKPQSQGEGKGQKQKQMKGNVFQAKTGDAFVEHLRKSVDLTDEEAAKIKKIYDDSQVTINEVREELKSVMTQRHEAINEILGKERTQELKKSAKKKSKERMGPGRPGPKSLIDRLRGKIAKELELTDEQQKQIKELRAESMKSIKKAIKEVNDKTDESLKTILTKEQQAKLAELKKKRPAKGMHGEHEECKEHGEVTDEKPKMEKGEKKGHGKKHQSKTDE